MDNRCVDVDTIGSGLRSGLVCKSRVLVKNIKREWLGLRVNIFDNFINISNGLTLNQIVILKLVFWNDKYRNIFGDLGGLLSDRLKFFKELYVTNRSQAVSEVHSRGILQIMLRMLLIALAHHSVER